MVVLGVRLFGHSIRLWVCFAPPLCSRGGGWGVFFSLLFGFGFVFRWVLDVVWYCSDTVQLLFCLNDFCRGLDGCAVFLCFFRCLCDGC